MTHICVKKQTSIGSDNGLSPGRRQAIFWTNAGILLIGPLVTNFSEIPIEIHILSLKKMHLKMSSGKGRPFYLGLNVLTKPLLTLGCGWVIISHTFLWKPRSKDHSYSIPMCAPCCVWQPRRLPMYHKHLCQSNMIWWVSVFMQVNMHVF